MKKYIIRIIIPLLLSAILCSEAVIPMIVCAEDTASAYSAERALPLLTELKIMNGDPDGNYRLSDTVTRAEFTKIAVAASDCRNSVASQLSISPFYDVRHTHWAAPYVRVGVTNNIVSGYPDSSFRPDNTVTFEEAVTIMLRVLGYSDSDFGAAWPSGQIGMADNLDMTDGLDNTAIGSEMTRSDVALLVLNTLRTKKKDSPEELITGFDAAFIDDVTLISTSKEDSSIPGDEVFTDCGSYKIRSDFDYTTVGMKGDLVIKDNKTVIGFFPDSGQSESEKYAVYSVLSDSVIVYRNNDMTSLTIKNGTTVYDGKNKTTYAAVKSGMEMGDVLSVKRTGGDIDYIVYHSNGLDGPYTAGADDSWANNIGLNPDTVIMRDGKPGTPDDIKQYDILYFVPELNMAFAYTNKVTGIYNSASPNSDNPTEVEVSGVRYKVEGSNAFKKLSSSGSFTIGDTVTLLLGRTNDVADVMTSSAANSEISGLVCGTGSKTYTSGDLKEYSSYYIDLVAPSGQTYSYTTSQNYSDYKNSVVRVSFSGGDAVISSAGGSAARGGTFDWDRRLFGSDALADDIDILDAGTSDKNEPSLYTTVHPQRIDGVNISNIKILYSHKNSSGKIDELILKDVTGDSYLYGVITSAESVVTGLHASGSYKFLVDGNSYTYVSASSAYSVTAGQAVKLSGTTNPSIMVPLSRLEGTIKLTSPEYITVDGMDYALADNVQVYEKEYSSTTLYRMRPISELIGNDNYNLTAFYDKSPASGGRVRIIIAMRK